MSPGSPGSPGSTVDSTVDSTPDTSQVERQQTTDASSVQHSHCSIGNGMRYCLLYLFGSHPNDGCMPLHLRKTALGTVH